MRKKIITEECIGSLQSVYFHKHLVCVMSLVKQGPKQAICNTQDVSGSIDTL